VFSALAHVDVNKLHLQRTAATESDGTITEWDVGKYRHRAAAVHCSLGARAVMKQTRFLRHVKILSRTTRVEDTAEPEESWSSSQTRSRKLCRVNGDWTAA
jgi:hypothetical protein